MHLSTLIFDAWRQVAQSRESILLDFYLKSAANCGISLDGAVNAADARRLFLERAKFDTPPTPLALDRMETRCVTLTRVCAWWVLLWSNLLPGLLIGYLLMRLISDFRHDVLFFILTAILAIPMFFAAAFVSLCLSALFARPFMAMVNRLLPAEEVS